MPRMRQRSVQSTQPTASWCSEYLLVCSGTVSHWKSTTPERCHIEAPLWKQLTMLLPLVLLVPLLGQNLDCAGLSMRPNCRDVLVGPAAMARPSILLWLLLW